MNARRSARPARPRFLVAATALTAALLVAPALAAEPPAASGSTSHSTSGSGFQLVPEAVGQIRHLALGPHGRLLLTLGDDGLTRLWQVAEGRLLRRVPGHHAALSPDGAFVVTASPGEGGSDRVRVWDTATGELRRDWESVPVHSLDVSSDGTLVAAGGQEGVVQVWSLESGELRHRLHSDSTVIRRVRFSPDSKLLASSSSDGMSVWNLRIGRPYAAFGDTADGPLAFAPDSSWLVTGDSSGNGHVWDLERRMERNLLLGHNRAIEAVAVSPDGAHMVTAGRDGAAYVWNPESGRPDFGFSLHRGRLTSLALSRDGLWALTGSADRTAFLWRTETSEMVRGFQPGDPVEAVAFSADGTHAAVGGGSTVGVWRTEGEDPVLRLDGSRSSVDRLAFSPGGSYLVAFLEETAQVWDLTGDRPPLRLEGQVVEVAAQGSLAVAGVGCCNGQVRIWDLATHRARATLSHSRPITFLALSPDGGSVATGGAGGEVRVWRTGDGRRLASFQGPRRAVTALTLAPGGEAVYAGYLEGSLVAWDLTGDPAARVASQAASRTTDETPRDEANGNGRERFRARHRRRGPVSRLRLLPGSDRARLVSSQRNELGVNVWDPEQGTRIQNLDRGGEATAGPIRSFELDAEERVLVTLPRLAPPGVWDVEEGQLRRHLEGHEGQVLDLACDGGHAVTAGADGTVRLWNLARGEVLHSFGEADARVRAVALDASLELVAAALDGAIVLWDQNTGDEVARLYSLAGDRWAVSTPDGRWDASHDGRIPELPVATAQGYSRLSDHPEQRQHGLLGQVLGARRAEE